MDTVCGAGKRKLTGDGGAEYPCVRRLRHRRLINFLWLQGMEAPTKLLTRVNFFSAMDLRLLVERGQWSDAVGHLSRFLPPPGTGRRRRSLSVKAAVLHRFLVVHMALADIVAGVKFSDHVATLRREYFSATSGVCPGLSIPRSNLCGIINHILRTQHQDWAGKIVYNLVYQTPELRQLAQMPGGPMDPHDVLPIWSGFRRSTCVKKQACGRVPPASAVAELYLRKRMSRLSLEPPDDLLDKTLTQVAILLDISLRTGQCRQNPLQTIGKEVLLVTSFAHSVTASSLCTSPVHLVPISISNCQNSLQGAPVLQMMNFTSHAGNSGAPVATVSQTMFGTWTDPAKTLGMPSVANAGAHVAAVAETMNLASHSQNSGMSEHLDQEGSSVESGFNPKKNPREELTTSDEQDLHQKRQRTTGAFGNGKPDAEGG